MRCSLALLHTQYTHGLVLVLLLLLLKDHLMMCLQCLCLWWQLCVVDEIVLQWLHRQCVPQGCRPSSLCWDFRAGCIDSERFPEWKYFGWVYSSEPGICGGIGDSCGNENRKSRKKYFPWGKNRQAYFFFHENEDDGSVNANWRYKSDIHYEFGVLDFFKFAPRMPQIAQILVLTFKIFRGSMPPDLPRNFLFFFLQQFQALIPACLDILWHVHSSWLPCQSMIDWRENNETVLGNVLLVLLNMQSTPRLSFRYKACPGWGMSVCQHCVQVQDKCMWQFCVDFRKGGDWVASYRMGLCTLGMTET